MRTRPFWFFHVLFVLVSVVSNCLLADDPPQKLSKEDKELLLVLIGHPLIDPMGKEYCTVTITSRSCWGTVAEVEVPAWHQLVMDKMPARVYFTDGDWIPAPKDFKKRDFIAESTAMITPPGSGKKVDVVAEAIGHMNMVTAGSAAGVPDLARAAWLAKLGREDLAVKIIAELKGDKTRWGNEPEDEPAEKRIVRRLSTDLAWRAYADAVHAYMQRADEEALRHATRLQEKYPQYVTEFGDGKALLAELTRRKEAKTLGVAAPEKPVDFDGWEKPRQVTWLVSQLDQVDARQFGQPGGVHLAGDWRVSALIEIGDPAVEELINVIEKDSRLTRSVHFWRDFARSRTVLSVREAALTAVMSILKVRVFEPAASGDNFTNRGKDEARDTAGRLRKYWKKYGKTPFEDRMMAVLADEASNQEALREAASNLAQFGDQRTIGTTVFSDFESAKTRGEVPNPVIKKFSSPTTAEAILSAMDRDLAQYDKEKRADDLWDDERQSIEATYIESLMQLGDKRIAPELRRRCNAANTIRMRRQWANAAHVLGDDEPLTAFANDFTGGKIKLPANDEKDADWNDQPGTIELAGIVGTLESANTPAADAALMALADPMHPGHSIAVRALRENSLDWNGEAWFAHPYCIKMLRRELDDKTLTGTVASIDEEGRYVEKTENSTSSQGIPSIISEPGSRRQITDVRRCDVAAEKLADLVIGLPPFHPLLKEADERLETIRKELDKNTGRFRRATLQELKTHDRLGRTTYVKE